MSKYKTLRYCYLEASINLNDNRHAAEVVKSLGITWKHGVGQSISDSFEFWGCENVPDELPSSIEIVDWNPIDRIGWGLSEQTAHELKALYAE